MLEILLTLGLHWGVPRADEFESSAGACVEAGVRVLALWGCYDKPDLRKFGQRMGEVETLSAGLVSRYDFNDTFFVFAGYGIAKIDVDPDDIIAHEVIETQLSAHRGPPPFAPETYRYDIDDGNPIIVGFGWTPREHIEIVFRYQYLRVEEEVQMWQGDCGRFPVPDACAGWWQEFNTLDRSEAQLEIKWAL